MQPLTEAQRELFERAGAQLRAAFGELVVASADEPAFFVALGEPGVRVNVEALGEDEAVLEAYCWLARELSIDAEVAMFLARQNVELRFGSLCIDGEDAIILQHALFAESVVPEVLERVVRLLAAFGQELEPELRARFA